MCSGFLCCVCGLIILSSLLYFVVLNLWIVPGFFVEVCSYFFLFLIAFFFLLPLDKTCSQVRILTSYGFCGAQ